MKHDEEIRMHALLQEPDIQIETETETEPDTFKIFIAYDGCSAISRARELQFELARRCRGKVQIHGSSWNFSLLAHPRLREQAAAEAADADMAVISTRGDSDIPGHLQLWIKNWLGCKQRSQAALVALLDPAVSDAGERPLPQPHVAANG